MLVFFILCIYSSSALIPTLFIPGLGGSRLKKNGISIWPPDIKWMLLNPEKYKNVLQYDTELETLPFGDNNAVSIYSNYMKLFIKSDPFKKILLYPKLHTIPYDFRLIHQRPYILSFNARLKEYIESFDEPIQCVAHSSGGLLFHYFLNCQTKEWKNKHIKEVYNVNVPFTGTIYSLKQITQSCIFDFISKDFLFSMGCVIMNLPNQQFMHSLLFVDSEERNYIEYFGLQKEYEIYKMNEDIINTFSVTNGVKTTIVYSTTDTPKTPITININNDKSVSLIYGEGDGVISLSSMLHPKIWSQPNLDFVHIKNVLHTDVLASDEFMELINHF